MVKGYGMETYPYVFAWGNNPVRAALKGRRCRIVASGAMSTVMIEFQDGQRVTTSRRALRRADGACRKGRTNGQD